MNSDACIALCQQVALLGPLGEAFVVFASLAFGIAKAWHARQLKKEATEARIDANIARTEAEVLRVTSMRPPSSTERQS